MPWQFRVVDGADAGRIEGMPSAGIVTVGSSKKHADVHLNDLYVARIHAEVEIDGARVVVTDNASPSGTLVNGQKIRQQEIRHGDVVRMGNSHLRLEDCDTAAQETPPPEEDVPELAIEVLDESQSSEEPVEVQAVDDDDVARLASNGATPAAPAKTSTGSENRAHALPSNRLKEMVGHTLAHFQVEDVIGVGHGAMVFRARDIKKDRLVALKVLAPDFPHGDAEMQRYVQVWKAVLPLRHPNLVTLLAVGKSGPYCWLASELVESVALPDVIERLNKVDKIDWHRAYRVAVQIGRALSVAHQQRIVHRNITARHVLWRTNDKVAKLADLGLASALQGSNLKRITLREKLQADMPYFSPEQTEPENFVDGVCDIYSLGVVVYALLTGRYPFAAPSQAELIRKIRDSQPIRPGKLQPEIPKRLEHIVLKMLAKRQEERYQTADALLADLQVVGEEEDALV